jgi:hypothetical protein
MAATTPTRVWAALVLATLGGFGVAEYLQNRVVAVLVIMAVVLLKAQLILRHFMELKAGPVAARAASLAWAGGCAAVIAGLYAYSAA